MVQKLFAALLILSATASVAHASGWTGPGWYEWDPEDKGLESGPYGSKAACEQALDKDAVIYWLCDFFISPTERRK